MHTITAIYENGLLRPLKPLKLTERETVELQIVPSASKKRNRTTLHKALAKIKWISAPVNDLTLVSEAALLTLADRIGQSLNKPLSQTIIEERGEW